MKDEKLTILVGGKLRGLRKKLGMTREQVATELGCHRNTVGMIERGTRVGYYFVSYVCLLKKKGLDIGDIFSME